RVGGWWSEGSGGNGGCVRWAGGLLDIAGQAREVLRVPAPGEYEAAPASRAPLRESLAAARASGHGSEAGVAALALLAAVAQAGDDAVAEESVSLAAAAWDPRLPDSVTFVLAMF